MSIECPVSSAGRTISPGWTDSGRPTPPAGEGRRRTLRRGPRGRHLTDDQRDGRERRAQFVRRGRCQAIELGQVLGARQDELRGGQRARRLARLGGDPIGVEGHKGGADRERDPDADQVERRQDKLFAADPRQRQTEARQHSVAHREAEEPERSPKRQRGRRDRDRGQKQDDEGIGDPAGQEEETGELKDVVAK